MKIKIINLKVENIAGNGKKVFNFDGKTLFAESSDDAEESYS